MTYRPGFYMTERERLKGKFTGEFVAHGKCNSKQPDWSKKLCGTKMTSQSHSQHNTKSKTYLRAFFCFVWYGFDPHVHWGLIHCGWSCALSGFLRIVYPKSRGGGFQKGGRQRTKPHRPQTGCLRFSLSVSHPLSLFPVEQEHGGGIHMDQRKNGTCSVIHSSSFFLPKCSQNLTCLPTILLCTYFSLSLFCTFPSVVVMPTSHYFM